MTDRDRHEFAADRLCERFCLSKQAMIGGGRDYSYTQTHWWTPWDMTKEEEKNQVFGLAHAIYETRGEMSDGLLGWEPKYKWIGCLTGHIDSTPVYTLLEDGQKISISYSFDTDIIFSKEQFNAWKDEQVKIMHRYFDQADAATIGRVDQENNYINEITDAWTDYLYVQVSPEVWQVKYLTSEIGLILKISEHTYMASGSLAARFNMTEITGVSFVHVWAQIESLVKQKALKEARHEADRQDRGELW